MAITRLDRTGDGTTTVYDVSFELGYLRREFVYVYLADDEYTNQLGYTWLNSTQIVMDSAPAVGVEFHIRRVIPRDQLVNEYEEGAILRDDNLDDSFVQSLMIMQEVADGYITSEPIYTVPIEVIFEAPVHVLDPTEDSNPASKKYSDEKDAETLESAKEYIRDYAYSKSETEQLDDETLIEANHYTDIKVNDTYVNDDPVAVMVAARQVGDGVNTVFQSPATKLDRTTNFLISIDGLSQKPLNDYTISNTGEVIFGEAPPAGAYVDVSYMNANILKLEGTDGVIPSSVPRFIADGVSTTYPTGTGIYIPEVLFTITLDGVVQRAVTDFLCTSVGEVEFTATPSQNTLIDIKWFQPNLVEQVVTASSVMLCDKYITQDLIITDPYNGLSVSPTLSEGVTVTVSEGSTYVVL